jgi:hypothetical protein
MKKYLPNEAPKNEIGFAVYSFAYIMGKIIEARGDDLTRENLLYHAIHLNNVPALSLLPGTTYNTSPDNYVPFKRLLVQKFDGQDWVEVTALTVERRRKWPSFDKPCPEAVNGGGLSTTLLLAPR